MIIVRVFGGLGNQLFQYAFGQFMSKKLNRKVLYDFSYFEMDNHRQPSILSYDLEINKVSFEQVKKYHPFKSFRLNSFFNKIFNPKTFCENEMHIDSNQPVLYFHNYWQDKKYTENTKNIIRSGLILNNNSKKFVDLKLKISNTISVSIHIRRDDYLLKKNQKKFTQLKSIYFFKSIDFIKKHLKEELNFFIFSDDLIWAKSHFFSLKNCQFISGNKDFEDLFLMSLCKHNIISNSTFSWWAAVLNKNPNKITIAPTDWFNGNLLKTNKLVFDGWYKI